MTAVTKWVNKLSNIENIKHAFVISQYFKCWFLSRYGRRTYLSRESSDRCLCYAFSGQEGLFGHRHVCFVRKLDGGIDTEQKKKLC